MSCRRAVGEKSCSFVLKMVGCLAGEEGSRRFVWKH